jgi:hypothetical protein
MTNEHEPPPEREGIGPFAIFGLVAILAAAGALLEMAYYSTAPALSGATLGTFFGICGALIAFFVWGHRAPRNE